MKHYMFISSGASLIETDRFIIETRVLKAAFPHKAEKFFRRAATKKPVLSLNGLASPKEKDYLEKLMQEVEAKGKRLAPGKIPVLVITEFGSWRKIDDDLCIMRADGLRRVLETIKL